MTLTQDIQAWTYNRVLGSLIGACKVANKINFYSLEPTTTSTDSASKELLFTFDSNLSDTVCSLASCNQGAICVLIEKSVPNEPLYQLQVFEIQYHTKIGELNFSEQIFTWDFHVVNNNAVITCKNNVIVVPILKETIRLSQLLTKNFTEEQKNEVKKRNTEKFKEFLGIPEQEEVTDLAQIRELNSKFNKIIDENRDDIPEELIVSLFNYFTRNSLLIKNKASEIKHRHQMLTELERFFGLLVKLPFNEIFLVSCLKSSGTTFAQCLLAIEWLLNLMPSKNPYSIITWISALLDANFRHFIINPSPDSQAALNRIYFHLNRCINFYEELGPIKTMFESLVKRNNTVVAAISNETYSIGQYAIELLSFT